MEVEARLFLVVALITATESKLEELGISTAKITDRVEWTSHTQEAWLRPCFSPARQLKQDAARLEACTLMFKSKVSGAGTLMSLSLFKNSTVPAS